MSKLLTPEKIVKKLQVEKNRTGESFSEFGRRYGVSPQYIYQVMVGKRLPGEAMGYRKVVLFEDLRNGKK